MTKDRKRHRIFSVPAVAAWMAAALILTGSAWAQQPQDPLTRWRARIDDAKRLNIPAPPEGIRDAPWQELAPPDWDLRQVMRQVREQWPGVDPHQADPNDPQVLAMERAMQEAFDTAPTVHLHDEAPIRLTGFAVMLHPGQGLAKTVLLVPYNGVGMDRRAPPANQMVLVVFKKGLPRNLEQMPIWVTGKMVPLASETSFGRVGYIIPAGRWQKFPADEYPLPRYRIPH